MSSVFNPGRCYLAQETPNDPLIVVLNSLIIINQQTDCMPVKDILLLLNRGIAEGRIVPKRRTNVETLFEVVIGGGVATIELQVYFVALRNGLRCGPLVVLPSYCHSFR